MKSSRRIRWAGVEFQADLQKPKKPVRLGIVLLCDDESGESSALILGRKPRLANRPPEFEEVSAMTLELAATWVENMAKDILESDSDPFERLTERWHWNLYLVRPVNVRTTADRQDLLTLARHKYESFVREQFRVPMLHRLPRKSTRRQQTPPPYAVPAPWLVEAISRNQLAPRLAATA